MANDERRQPSVIEGTFKKPFPEQVAFFRGKLGRLVPTRRWDDIQRSAHDTSFMVAGAGKANLLSDLAAAVDRSISEGKSLQAFRQDFREIVQRNGWHDFTGSTTAAGRAWRTRIIYTTNASTSYAAGRLAQLQEGGFSLMVYRHNDSVLHPRPLHLSWDGLALTPDDPFWRAHYPPNGWGCRCFVVGARSERGARRLGGDPGKPRPANFDTRDPKTGAPVGIDRGWDFAPGESVTQLTQSTARQAATWAPSLATAFLADVPRSLRSALISSFLRLRSVADDTRRAAERLLREDES